MSERTLEVILMEIRQVADLLHRAYPYILAKKRAEGVLGEPPLNSLIRGILSQHTTDANRDRAFACLRERYASWEAVTSAPLNELHETIRVTNHARTKALRIQHILRSLALMQHGLTLDFLQEWSTERILEFLTSFPGVGPKTAAIVCLFSLGRPVMAVDVHVHRVTGRLGWIGTKETPERAHRLLQAMIPCELILPLHVGLWEHGHRTCRPVPKCAQCAIYRYCEFPAKTAPEPPVNTAIALTAGSTRQAA